MINYQFFPRSQGVTDEMKAVINAFKNIEAKIDSSTKNLSSNEVLAELRPYLERIGYHVETGKKADDKIDIPVLFGIDNSVDKSFMLMR